MGLPRSHRASHRVRQVMPSKNLKRNQQHSIRAWNKINAIMSGMLYTNIYLYLQIGSVCFTRARVCAFPVSVVCQRGICGDKMKIQAIGVPGRCVCCVCSQWLNVDSLPFGARVCVDIQAKKCLQHAFTAMSDEWSQTCGDRFWSSNLRCVSIMKASPIFGWIAFHMTHTHTRRANNGKFENQANERNYDIRLALCNRDSRNLRTNVVYCLSQWTQRRAVPNKIGWSRLESFAKMHFR